MTLRGINIVVSVFRTVNKKQVKKNWINSKSKDEARASVPQINQMLLNTYKNLDNQKRLAFSWA